MQSAFGSYTGNGAPRSIAGVTFQPRFLVIGGGANNVVLRTDTMPTDSAKPASGSSAPVAGIVTSLDPDGFSLGTDARANANGTTYYWWAVGGGGASDFVTFTYTGDGIDGRSLETGAFQPEVAIIISAGTDNPVWRPASLTGDFTLSFSGTSKDSNRIQVLQSTGLELGSAGAVNGNGVTYHGVCLKAVAGFLKTLMYTGDGVDNRSITGFGLTPAGMWIKSEGSVSATWRTTSMAGDLSKDFDATAPATNRIQALEADGGQVGTASRVNTLGALYHAFGIEAGTTGAGSAPTAPSGLTATAVSDTQIDLAWTDNANNETGFKIERAPDAAGSPGTFAEITTVAADVIAYQDLGRTPSTKYWYRIRATNEVGDSSYTSNATATTQADVTPPAISGQTATNITDTGATIVFNTNELATSVLQYDTNSGFSAPTEVVVSSGLTSSHSKAVSGLLANTIYYYRVRATDASNNTSGWSASTFLTTAGGAAWTNSAVPAEAGFAFIDNGALVHAMYESITVECKFTETTFTIPRNTVIVQYREVGGATHQTLRPSVIRPTDGTPKTIFAIPFMLHANTDHEVRIAVTGEDDITYFRVGSVRTKAYPGALQTITHVLDKVNGNDANDGTVANPVKTTDRMIAIMNAATGRQFWQIKKHAYRSSQTVLVGNGFTHEISCENDAVDNSRELVTDASHHTGGRVIFYDKYTAPAGTPVEQDADPSDRADGYYGKNAWTSEVVGGVTVYWLNIATIAGTNYTNHLQVGHGPQLPGSPTAADYRIAKYSTPTRINFWDDASASSLILTLAQWANHVSTNRAHRVGAWQSRGSNTPNINPERLYVYLPGGANPNNCYMWVGREGPAGTNARHGIAISGPGHRVRGIEFRVLPSGGFLKLGAHNTVFENCSTETCSIGIYLRANSGETGGATIDDTLAYRCLFYDAGTWDISKQNWAASPYEGASWKFIKGQFYLADGTLYPGNLGRTGETNGVTGNESYRWLSCMDCSFIGTFNGVSGGTTGLDRYDGFGCEIARGKFRYNGDNPLEPQSMGACWAMWLLDIQDCSTVISLDLAWGPIILALSLIAHISGKGLNDDGSATFTNDSFGSVGNAIKWGSGKKPGPEFQFVYNTVYNVDSIADNVPGITNPPFSNKAVSGSGEEDWYRRGNVIRNVGKLDQNISGKPAFDVDYDFMESQQDPATQYAGGNANTPAAFRTLVAVVNNDGYTNPTPNNINKIGSTEYSIYNPTPLLDTWLTSPSTGDYTPAAGSPLIGAGPILPGVKDTLWPGSGPVEPYHYTNPAGPTLGRYEPAVASDTTPPVISGVQATSILQTTATITWTTDELSNSQVEYGLTTAYGSSTAIDETDVLSHSRGLTGLTPNTLYHYRVKSRDPDDNLATSIDFTFTTLATGVDITPPVISAVLARVSR